MRNAAGPGRPSECGHIAPGGATVTAPSLVKMLAIQVVATLLAAYVVRKLGPWLPVEMRL